MTDKTKTDVGPVGSMAIGVVGTVVSAFVTIMLKKLFTAKGVPERAKTVKSKAAEWVADKASAVASVAKEKA